MKPVCTAAQVREMDRYTIDVLGIPGVVLMELASRGVAEHVLRCYPVQAKQGVVVVCGGGNNGGDGYGCARWLHLWGLPVAVWPLTASSSGDAGTMRAACAAMGISEVCEIGDARVAIDAVFGTGLSRPIVDRFAAVVKTINAAEVVVAVDVPSGVCADTGRVLGAAVKADSTVSFGVRKRGFYGEPGPDNVGSLEVIDIGLGAAPQAATTHWIEAEDLRASWPRRQQGAHKGQSGHLLVVAGSTEMAGAAILACQGALAAGVGLVTLVSARGAYSRLEGLAPEVMVVFGGDGDRVERLPEQVLDRADAVLCGPGLGGGEPLGKQIAHQLQEVWEEWSGGVVFDADALSCAATPGIGPRVMTPHPGEAGRLLGTDSAAVQRDRFEAALRLSDDGTCVLLKGRNTLVASAGNCFVNPVGNSVLATAGSGDVLAGLVAGLMARGVPAVESARLGAYIHGLCGELLARRALEGWTASDIGSTIPEAVEALIGNL